MRYIVLYILFFVQVNSFGQESVQFDLLRDKAQWQEKIIFQTNKDYFITGETLRFGLTCLLPNNNLSNISKVAYIELIDEERESVLRQKIELHQGLGNGDLYLPSILKSGKYVIIAYTKWMRNFSLESISQSGITIINPFKPLSQNDSLNQIGINFFPESGAVVPGNPIMIVYEIHAPETMNFKAFKIVDHDGKVVYTKRVIDQRVGRFVFTPIRVKPYTAILIDENENLHYSTIDFQFSEYHLMVEQNGQKVDILPVYPENKIGSIQIDEIQEQVSSGTNLRVDLPIGLHDILLLIKDSIACSRTVFIPPKQQELQIKLSKNDLGTRELNSFYIDPLNEPAKLKVVIRQINGLTKKDHSIHDHFIHRYPFFNLPLNVENINALENLVIIHQQSRKEFTPEQLFLPEMRGPTLSGKIETKEGTPLENMQISLSLQNVKPQLFYTNSKDDGSFSFIIPEVYGIHDGFLFTASNENKLILESPYLEKYEFVQTEKLTIGKNELESIREQSVLVQLKNAYFEYNSDSILPSTAQGIFYGKPSRTYVIDDYTPLPTMNDIFKEYITEVSVRKIDSRSRFHVSLISNFESQEDSALLLLNGIPLSDPDVILALSPSSVEKIDIINQDFLVGHFHARGIVHVYTKKLKMNNPENLSNIEQISVEGLQHRKTIFYPDYSKAEIFTSRIPDLRTDLYWNPHVEIKYKPVEFSFYTSDIEGDYEIVVSGTTKSGKCIDERRIFSVKK